MGSPSMAIVHVDTAEHTQTQRLILTEELDWKYKIKYILSYEIQKYPIPQDSSSKATTVVNHNTLELLILKR